ncbi:MAG: hypothetical protein ABFD49_11875 [Armatimonadota bacterium]|nr:hypothetical protein [bacterium]
MDIDATERAYANITHEGLETALRYVDTLLEVDDKCDGVEQCDKAANTSREHIEHSTKPLAK